MESESASGGGPGGEEGAREQGGAVEVACTRWALSSSCMEVTAATRTDMRSSGGGGGRLAMASVISLVCCLPVRLRRLAEVVSPGAKFAGGAVTDGAAGIRGPGARCAAD